MFERIHPRFDWGLLLALALALVAAAPFLTRPGLPRQTDAELHVYRAAELGHVMRAGVFYPRWAPDFYFGYGYPIFNYYAPLTYYLANLFDLLPGIDIVGGVKAVFVFGFVAASLGTYLLGRDFSGMRGGTVAAASFVFAPYVVFIDPHARGVLAEHFALCLLPMVFFTFRRLMSGPGSRGALLGSVLTLAVLVFSHNLVGLVGAGLLSAYWLWEVGVGTGRKRAGWGVLVFVLAASIIAFFWLPFLLERDAIKLQVIGPGHFDYREHFLSWAELLAPSRVLDLGATAPHYQHNLGLAQWLLAVPALGVLLRRKDNGTPQDAFLSRPISRRYPRIQASVLYFYVLGLGLAFLMTPGSKVIWQCFPGMPYLQFPWRLMGPTNLMLAVCAAGSVSALSAVSSPRWHGLVPPAILMIILGLALPVLYPPSWPPDFGGTSPHDIIEWEQQSLAVGTTSTGDFLPIEAALAPVPPMPTLIESYLEPGPVDRVNRAALPHGARVEILEHGPLSDRFMVSTPKKFILRIYTFYFPGWKAYVDDKEVEISVAGPEGFITLVVPKGDHDVLVRFEDTLLRVVGWIISAIGVLMLAVAFVLMRRPEDKEFGGSLPASSLRTFLGLGAVVLLFVAVKSGLVDLHDNWLRYTSPPGQAWAAQYERRTGFGGQIELLGYDLPRRSVRSGDEFTTVLYWRALVPLDVNYQSFVHVARPVNILWGQEDHLNPAGLPTTRWPLDRYVWDEYKVRVLPGTPPGEYVINVGLYSMAGGYRLQSYDGSGSALGDSVIIDSISVRAPRRPPRATELDMTQEVMAVFPEAGVTLLGYSQPLGQTKLPGLWSLTLFWRADCDQPAARIRDVVLLDGSGKQAWGISGVPANGSYPFDAWRAGEVVRDPLQFVAAGLADIPKDIKDGTYRFGVVVSAGETADTSIDGTVVPIGTVEFRIGGEMD
jgi:hypothetical protein